MTRGLTAVATLRGGDGDDAARSGGGERRESARRRLRVVEGGGEMRGGGERAGRQARGTSPKAHCANATAGVITAATSIVRRTRIVARRTETREGRRQQRHN